MDENVASVTLSALRGVRPISFSRFQLCLNAEYSSDDSLDLSFLLVVVHSLDGIVRQYFQHTHFIPLVGVGKRGDIN